MSKRVIPGTDTLRLEPDGSLLVGGATSYQKFNPEGTSSLAGNATYWVDIDFPIIIRTTGVGIPALTTFNGRLTMPEWGVNDLNMCESQEFIHAWKEGSRCYWHIHLTTNGSDAGDTYVNFELEYAYTDSNFAWTFPAVVTTGDLLIPGGTATKTQIIMSIADFLPTGTKIGGHALAYLKRIASVGTAPTNDPWIPMLQMHVECDSNGSNLIATK